MMPSSSIIKAYSLFQHRLYEYIPIRAHATPIEHHSSEMLVGGSSSVRADIFSRSARILHELWGDRWLSAGSSQAGICWDSGSLRQFQFSWELLSVSHCAPLCHSRVPKHCPWGTGHCEGLKGFSTRSFGSVLVHLIPHLIKTSSDQSTWWRW